MGALIENPDKRDCSLAVGKSVPITNGREAVGQNGSGTLPHRLAFRIDVLADDGERVPRTGMAPQHVEPTVIVLDRAVTKRFAVFDERRRPRFSARPPKERRYG